LNGARGPSHETDSLRSLGCGDDLVEARITAQRIPARIEAQIVVCRASRDFRNTFELLERAVTLAGPRVNEGQVRDTSRTGIESLAIGLS